MISLFVGIESFNWQWSDFDNLIAFCKQHKVEQVFLKVYEITQGFWYQNLDTRFTDVPNGYKQPLEYLKQYGINTVPYGFFYGNDWQSEVKAINKLCSENSTVCLDMEGGFDGLTTMKTYQQEIVKGNATLMVSTWANVATHGWIENIQAMDSLVDVWMPQAYDDNLVKEMYAQFPKVLGKIQPTFHLQNTPVVDASIYNDFSLWEYQLCQQTPNLLDAYVAQNNGEKIMNYPTNNSGMIANYLPVSEFQPDHSEFECGAYAVALNGRASNYNVNNPNNVYNLNAWAQAAYAATAGSNKPSNTAGASIDDMHRMIKMTQSAFSTGSPNALHWWDIVTISPKSSQSQDIAQIKAALQHGYPVIATVSEQSVYDVQLKANPYWWGPSANHILTYVGISNNGNLLAIDPANVIKGDGNLQTPKTPKPWPREYDITRLDNSWATIIQLPWLLPIPNGNPISWPEYQPPTSTPAPPKQDNITTIYDEGSKQLIFMSGSTAIYRIQL